MLLRLFACTILLLAASIHAADGARFEQTPYSEQKVVYDFYFDHPDKINSALYWIRSLINPLTDAPYNYAPDFLNIVVVIHGTEIAALAKKNFERYREAVQRMRYYQQLGVEFRVCSLAADDFGYKAADFHDFVILVPSAMTELAHWQLLGYALITPNILSKQFSTEEIR